MSAFIDTIRRHPPDPGHPLVTINIPVKDPDEEIFTQCLESVLRQPLLPYCEILVVDSSTRPVRTFEKFKDVLTITPLTRKNLSGTRQDAVAQAKGAAEDHDFATRLRRRGYHIVYAPGARVRHYHRETLRAFLKQQGWHGLGYGQTVVKNGVDIYSHRPIRHLLKQVFIAVCFPLFLIQIGREYKKGKREGVQSYLIQYLTRIRFLAGILRGMATQGGWPYLKKRFFSDVFSSYPGGTGEPL